MLTPFGAKLLDFGLARAGTPPCVQTPDDATVQEPLTHKGAILGHVSVHGVGTGDGGEADTTPTSSPFARCSTR